MSSVMDDFSLRGACRALIAGGWQVDHDIVTVQAFFIRAIPGLCTSTWCRPLVGRGLQRHFYAASLRTGRCFATLPFALL